MFCFSMCESLHVGAKSSVGMITTFCDDAPLEQLAKAEFALDCATYASLLRSCIAAKDLCNGERIHSHMLQYGCNRDTFLGNLLVQLYGVCGRLYDARRAFDAITNRNVYSWTIMVTAYAQNGNLREARNTFNEMPTKNSASWNTMIAAYAQGQLGKEAIELYRMMNQEGTSPDKRTFVHVIVACASLTSLTEGRAVHANATQLGFDKDPLLATAILGMYGKCGSLKDAINIFKTMVERTVVSWSSMITAYAQNGHLVDSCRVLDKMPEHNVVSWNAMVAAYSKSCQLKEARQIFDQMISRDETSWNGMLAAYAQHGHLVNSRNCLDKMPQHNVATFTSMIAVYGQHGLLEEARNTFNDISQPDVVAWNAIIVAYAQTGHLEEARELFDKMEQKSASTWNGMITAYAETGNLREARGLFDAMPQPNTWSWSSMVTGYAQQGQLQDAKIMFQRMPRRDVVSWNNMIAAYTKNGECKESIKMYKMMRKTGAQPNEATFIGALHACAESGALNEGKEIHKEILKSTFETLAVETALINMYGKCGDFETAKSIFDKLPSRDSVAWAAIICAYSQSGHGIDAMGILQSIHVEGIEPDVIAFVHILAACSHAGLLNDAWTCFTSMQQDTGLTPCSEQYSCMIDLLGRAGQLDRAEELLNNMPFEPDSTAWTSYLGACRVQAERRKACDHHVASGSAEAASYSLLSNMCT